MRPMNSPGDSYQARSNEPAESQPSGRPFEGGEDHAKRTSAPELEIAIAALSHDLRAPLRAIDAYMYLLAAELPVEAPVGAMKYIDRTHRAVALAQGLIEQLLTFLRCGHETLERSDVDLSALASSILDELKAVNPQHSVRIHIEPDLRAYADPSLARRLLQNLLGNAWKFTQHVPNPAIRFYATESASSTSFCIEDSGCGFDMAAADQLFKPFRRLHSTYEGYGMGLAIVQRIVSLHAGTVSAEGEPLKGARFTFTLPKPSTSCRASCA
jgi:signal transduction histidine kinase